MRALTSVDVAGHEGSPTSGGRDASCDGDVLSVMGRRVSSAERRPVQPIKKQEKLHQVSMRAPSCDRALHASVIHRRRTPEPDAQPPVRHANALITASNIVGSRVGFIGTGGREAAAAHLPLPCGPIAQIDPRPEQPSEDRARLLSGQPRARGGVAVTLSVGAANERA